MNPPAAAAGSDGALTLGLFHLAIKTADLALTRAFWCGVIGLREVARPDFGYPGAWLACPQPGGQAIVHVYAGGPALGGLDQVPAGTAAIDHLSLACVGYHAYRARLQRAGLDWREFLVPGTTLWQLFVYDPSGVQLELTFEGAAEAGAAPDMSEGRVYRAGQSFFHAPAYPRQTLLSFHGETRHATR
ncbi:MAG TPA: glyoxalase [Hydrogenophaga sp.]|uniref:glyoxalase n=1 Tax=Hydrogenophaga sp. TaxID=1904254 RepID=UPI002C5CB6DA|nr:glyoxalase [Hydrogenophaga sp.]HSX93137.1 glyoxalase [Hydrogenophaga sp.]